MIDDKFAKDQIRRLQCLKFFPTDPLAARELITALRPAQSESIAKAAIDDFVGLLQECPVPADIKAAIESRAIGEYVFPYSDPGPKCPACNASGMIQENGTWVRCLCADGRDMPKRLLDIANSKPPLGKGKSDSQSRRYVDRVLIR